MSSTRQPETPPFLVDRTYGEAIAQALRDLGFEAQTLADVYGAKPSEKIDDPVWIERIATEGWVGVTKDELKPWKGTIVRAHAKVLRIGREAKNTTVQKEWLENNRYRIEKRCTQKGPWLWVVRQKKLEPVALPAEVW